jgi:hypothetical protein
MVSGRQRNEPDARRSEGRGVRTKTLSFHIQSSLILILNPLHRPTYSFHPVFALVGSVIMVCLYVQVCWLNPFVAYAS